tara:strand:+ start:438 stop:1058 length:621 start_codon:yes stop_codon:yes gene_type:complete
MTAILKVDTIQDTAGNNIINESSNIITIGASGDTTNIVGTLQNNGSALISGITVADQWRINSSISASAGAFTDITANWERVDTAGQGFIGTAMSQSSGIFTFPSTGVYLVQTQLNFVDSSAANTALGCQIAVTVNNSSYTRVADNYTSNHSGSNVNTTAVTQSLVDVTNTTNVKVKFQYYVSAAVTIYCPTDVNTSFVTFTRLGDT